jgi:hypothetical protein
MPVPKVIRWRNIIRESRLKPHTKLILLVLSTYMDQNGNNASPSTRTLAMASSLNRRTVLRHLQDCYTWGWISWTVQRSNQHRRREYQATWPPDLRSIERVHPNVLVQ